MVGRMAASMLHAVGLPELVTENLADYVALAEALARDPARLQALRDKLEHNRLQQPLFDTARFTRHLEQSYATMWETWQRGERPSAFRVTPIA
jgi:predicted O-linked N-acetylglucosamine transferase (SPINDLY family)